jgi:hypothetical protein
MADQNIIVRITGEADLEGAQSQIRELTDRSKELESQMKALSKAEAEDAESIRKLGLQGQQLSDALKKNADYYRAQRQELEKSADANNKNIASLKNSVRQYNVLQGAAGKSRQQLMEMREALVRMAEDGDTTSATFIAMSERAAELSDTIGDAQQVIALLASDTKNLDTAMQVGGGLVGAFNAATSAMALLGGESEELQQAFLKVQAAMSVLNGVQQVMTVLDKRSAANVVLRTALIKLFNREKVKEASVQLSSAAATTAHAGAATADATATTAATVATKGFTKALLANPFGAILAAVAALVAGVILLTKAFDKSKQEMQAYADSTKEAEKQLGRLQDKLEAVRKRNSANVAVMQAQGASEEAIHAQQMANLQEELALEQQTFNAQKKIWQDAVKKRNEILKSKRSNKKKNAMIEEMGLTDDDIAALYDAYKAAASSLKDAQTALTVEEESWYTKMAERQDEETKKRAEQIKEAERQLADIKIALMKDGQDKEIARINLEYERKAAAIEGNSVAEVQLRAKLEEQKQQEIAAIEKKYADEKAALQDEIAKIELENELLAAENSGAVLYDVKKRIMQEQAELEIANITRSVDNEELRAQKIFAVNEKLAADLKALEKEKAADAIDTARLQAENRVAWLENTAMKIINSETSTNEEIKQARNVLANHEENLRRIRLEELEKQKAAMLITEDEYQAEKLAIEREALEQEKEVIAARSAETQQLVGEIMNFAADMASEIFGAISDSIQRQLDDLDNLYTTDAEEAKENSKKKYISEKELEDKKLELKRRAAAVEKTEAAFAIAMNTAMAIMRIWADVPKVDFGATTIAMTAMAAALGATQLAMVLAKPLPAYAKGRKGGKGEYAMVGERGAELMYIPDGASIIPNNKLNYPETWAAYGVPALPHVGADVTSAVAMNQLGVDYARLGKTIADNIPLQKAVNVMVDQNGITIDDDGNRSVVLNKKYSATWI